LNIGRGRPTNEVSSDSQNKWDVKAHLLFYSDAVTIHFWHKIDNVVQNRRNIKQRKYFVRIWSLLAAPLTHWPSTCKIYLSA